VIAWPQMLFSSLARIRPAPMTLKGCKFEEENDILWIGEPAEKEMATAGQKSWFLMDSAEIGLGVIP